MAKKKMTLEEKLEDAIINDTPYDIPANWMFVKLVNLLSGMTTKKPNKDEEFFRYIDIDAIDNKNQKVAEPKIVEVNKAPSRASREVMEGDIVFSTVRPYLKNIALIPSEYKDCIASTGFYVCRCKEVIRNKYLYYLLCSERVINYYTSLMRGDNSPSIRKEEFENLIVPLPPLNEQQRIVDKIESLFEKLDKAKELIEEARDEFQNRKSAILEKAFRGEFTKNCRSNHKYKNILLESLGNQNNIVKKNFKFSHATELFDLPDEWFWIKLKDVCEKFKYGTSAKSKEEGKIPVLRMGNLQDGKLDWSNLVYTSDEEEIIKYDLKPGDLLFNRTNSPELVGKTSIYEGEREAIYAGYLIRVRTFEGVSSKYINYFMNSIFAKHRCMEVKSDGVSQSNINAEKLGDFDIPLPSIEEQLDIVRILDKVLEEELKIEELTKLEKQIESIKKSILAKAFRGQLRTNSEQDENALELLKEILSKE